MPTQRVSPQFVVKDPEGVARCFIVDGGISYVFLILALWND